MKNKRIIFVILVLLCACINTQQRQQQAAAQEGARDIKVCNSYCNAAGMKTLQIRRRITLSVECVCEK